jgi:hypothetical protein
MDIIDDPIPSKLTLSLYSICLTIGFTLESQRPFQVVSHIHYNLNANEDFVIFFTF